MKFHLSRKDYSNTKFKISLISCNSSVLYMSRNRFYECLFQFILQIRPLLRLNCLAHSTVHSMLSAHMFLLKILITPLSQPQDYSARISVRYPSEYHPVLSLQRTLFYQTIQCVVRPQPCSTLGQSWQVKPCDTTGNGIRYSRSESCGPIRQRATVCDG